MKNPIVSALLAVVGVCLVPAAEAHAASWTIRVDNWGNPDHPSNWATNDDIIVEIGYWKGFIFNEYVSRRTLPHADVVAGSHDIIIDQASIPLGQVIYISIMTNGNDLFVIDEFEVLDTNGNRYFADGIDNMRGYCLTTDPADFEENEHCLGQKGGPTKTWSFIF